MINDSKNQVPYTPDAKELSSPTSLVMTPGKIQKQTRNFILSPEQVPYGFITPLMLAATDTVANGDLYYSTGSVFTRLPGGTAGQVLTMSGGVPSWATPASGYSGTITTAKLTSGGTNGSITVVNGLITAVTAAT